MTIFLTKKDYFSPFIPQKNSKFAALEHYNSMERLLHYVWKHKMLPLGDLLTTDGRVVEILDPGLLNRNAGPDFFNAKVKIGSTLWVGNVEIHLRASDWYHHCHDRDPRYNNVVLHVVSEADMDVKTQDGNYLPQMVVQIPASLKENYEELLHNDQYPPCYKIIPDLTRLQVHSWLAALQTERLEQKTQAIQKRVEQCNGSWEDGYFVTLARNYGFGINGEAFEMWANTATTSSKSRLSSWDRQDCYNWRASPSTIRRRPSTTVTLPSCVMNTSTWLISSRSPRWILRRGASCVCVRRTSPISASRSWLTSTMRGRLD